VVQDLIRKGWAEQQAGRSESAKSLYNQALRIDPRQPDALNLLGVLALQERDPERAAALIGKAIELQQSNPGFHANLGQAYLELRRVPEAHGAFRQAAILDPRNPQFAVGAAVCLALQGHAAQAEEQLRAVARKHPRYPLAWYNLGNVLRDAGRLPDAADSYRKTIALEPAFADAHNDLGRILHLLHRFDEAEDAYRRHLALAPDSTTGIINLASLLIDRGKPADAVQLCGSALARGAGQGARSDLQWMQGVALARQGNLTSALIAQRAAVESAPRHARALWSMGSALLHTGRTFEGLHSIARAQQAQPELPEFRQAMAGVYLASGNLQLGWREYRKRPARVAFGEKFPGVELTAGPVASVSAKKILVFREQGLGDELFFLRFAPQLKSRGAAAVTYFASPKIATLLARVTAIDLVTTDPAQWPAADLAVLAGDLPALMEALDASPYPPARAMEAGLPPAFPLLPRIFYPEIPRPLTLEARPQGTRDMRDRLSALGPPPYVGLTWRAGTAPEQQGAEWMLHKEFPLGALGAALRGTRGTLLALQRQPQEGEIGALSQSAARPVHDLTALNEDLEGMLALLGLIEEYIGVSNTNMHLRAGAGRSARVLVPRPAEWRWLTAGDESPWFPGFRVYRQRADGGWGPAFERLERDLRAAHGRHE
jgi:tetratricopeptide (TPR) repeat protein